MWMNVIAGVCILRRCWADGTAKCLIWSECVKLSDSETSSPTYMCQRLQKDRKQAHCSESDRSINEPQQSRGIWATTCFFCDPRISSPYKTYTFFKKFPLLLCYFLMFQSFCTVAAAMSYVRIYIHNGLPLKLTTDLAIILRGLHVWLREHVCPYRDAAFSVQTMIKSCWKELNAASELWHTL